jgi:8-oxo-dGTP pyrophosphatase MutT (NUDIX family)
VSLPDWLQPVADAARTISVEQLTRYNPPANGTARRSAVLMLFGEGPEGPDLLLTERNHTMRSHPGHVAFPGGSLDPGETSAQAALREAWEETGLEPTGVEVFAELPALWVPASDHAVTPVLGWWQTPSPVAAVSPDEVHAVYRTPIRELVDPQHRITVRLSDDYRGPGFLIGEDHDVIVWGFTAGIIARLFAHVGWMEDLPEAPVRPLPAYMLDWRRA